MPAATLDNLPHRPPFRFLTRITALNPGRDGTAVWSVGGDEPFFAGHFPGDPLVPGVLLGEALAQLSGLVGLHHASGDGGLLVHVDLRFDLPVRPPADIALRATQTRTLGALTQFDVSAALGGAVVARGSLTLAARATGQGAAREGAPI